MKEIYIIWNESYKYKESFYDGEFSTNKILKCIEIQIEQHLIDKINELENEN